MLTPITTSPTTSTGCNAHGHDQHGDRDDNAGEDAVSGFPEVGFHSARFTLLTPLR
jgi:hypothetical protein